MNHTDILMKLPKVASVVIGKMNCEIEFTDADEVKNACILFLDGSQKIYVSNKYVKQHSLTEDQVALIVFHELHHYMLGHRYMLAIMKLMEEVGYRVKRELLEFAQEFSVHLYEKLNFPKDTFDLHHKVFDEEAVGHPLYELIRINNPYATPSSNIKALKIQKFVYEFARIDYVRLYELIEDLYEDLVQKAKESKESDQSSDEEDGGDQSSEKNEPDQEKQKSVEDEFEEMLSDAIGYLIGTHSMEADCNLDPGAGMKYEETLIAQAADQGDKEIRAASKYKYMTGEESEIVKQLGISQDMEGWNPKEHIRSNGQGRSRSSLSSLYGEYSEICKMDKAFIEKMKDYTTELVKSRAQNCVKDPVTSTNELIEFLYDSSYGAMMGDDEQILYYGSESQLNARGDQFMAAIDTSGSNSEFIAPFFSFIRKNRRIFGNNVIHMSGDIKETPINKLLGERMEFFSNGATDVDVLTEYLVKKKYKNVLLFTDDEFTVRSTTNDLIQKHKINYVVIQHVDSIYSNLNCKLRFKITKKGIFYPIRIGKETKKGKGAK